ncbi:type III-A CRISPR-associated protein Csm2 [Chloroflexia bacterium SDU3-3]|nr:type III-A CRISPR-associated protein Csm2 [Chloroflexia bacterium SDU3-3]
MSDERAASSQWVKTKVSDTTLKQILTEESSKAIELLDQTAEIIGQELHSLNFTTSQIRAVFGRVRTIEQMVNVPDVDTKNGSSEESIKSKLSLPVYTELRLLRPKLAYQYGRTGGEDKRGKEKDNQKVAMGILQQVLSNAVAIVNDDAAAFQRFVSFFEAILAYHRYYGGKNS